MDSYGNTTTTATSMMKASSIGSVRLRLLLHCTKFSSSVSFSSFGSSSPNYTSPSSKIGSSSVSFKSFSSLSNNNQGNNNIVDTLIIGGGPIGSSTAYHLGQMLQEQGQQHHNRNYNIVVLEKDPSYNSSSATSSAGGIRQHFSLKENILMSMYGRDFLRNCGRLLTPNAILDNTTGDGNGDDDIVDVQFVENGYLFLTDNEIGKLNLIENNKVQRDANCTTTQLMTPTELATKFPWLNTSDLLLGSYGTSGEGWFDPWLYIQALKKKNQDDLGITYITGKPIKATTDDVSGRILSVDILLSRGDGDVSTTSSSSSDIMTLHINNVVNAAGAYASELMNLLSSDKSLKYPLPVVPRKRCIFYFHCSEAQDDHDHHVIIPEIAPLTVDSSNVYFRSEGKPGSNTYICGVSPSSEDDTDFDFTGQTREVTEEDYQDLFLERIWPSIYHRVPAFANIKVINSWSGLYEYNAVDQNAIIDYHPEIPNVLLVNGFSGHGLQQSPAAGRAIAELILFDGQYQSLDLSIFKFDRCMMDEDGQPIRPPVFERGIV